MNLFCNIGWHKWVERIPKPFLGRRNLNHMENGYMVMEQGPEEMFYPDHQERECLHCKKRQIRFHGKWF